MIKKWIKIPNDIIQWTKKWHFFHFLAWGAVIPTFFLICIVVLLPLIIILCIINNEINDIQEILDLLMGAVIFLYLLCAYLTFIIAIPLTGIAITVKLIFYKKIIVTNKFFLENKWYNIYYTISLVGIVIATLIEIIT